MRSIRIALCAGAALALLSACERASAVAGGGGEPDGRAAAGSTAQAVASLSEAPRGPARDEDVRLVNGKPMWSASRRGTAKENAQRSFERNGEAFGAQDLDAFVAKAHAFIDHPPAGTLTLNRANGDVMLYDPKANVFAVATKAGAPRTMFKPDQGRAYWDEQTAREAKRQTARAERRKSDGDDG